MLRFVLLIAFLLALPMVLYIAYARLRTGQTTEEVMTRMPIVPLAIAGALLTAAVLLVYLQLNRNEPGGHYVPPALEDGKIKPGYVE